MSKIKGVVLYEFQLLIDFAKKHHAYQNEPIPQIFESQYDKINSCLETPFQTFDKHLLYKGFFKKAAILFYLFCKNHALVNGNKRMACLVLGYFCMKNKYELNFSMIEFYELANYVTNSDPSKKDIVLDALEETIKKFTFRK